MNKIPHRWMNWRQLVIDDKELPFHSKALALFLSTYMNDSHDMAYPSVSTICGRMSLGSNKTAIKYLAILEEKGYLMTEKRYGNSKIYTAVIPSSVRGTLMYEVHDSSVRGTPTVVYDVHTNNQENNQKNNQVKRSGSKRPSLADVKNLVEEKGYHFNPNEFFNHYEAIGWVYGKNKIPIKKWESCAIQWESRHREKNPERTSVRLDATGKPLKPNGGGLLL